MSWNTPKASINNIEIYSSDIDLNTDNVESDLVVQHGLTNITNSDLILLETLSTATNSDLVVQHGLTNITNSDLVVIHDIISSGLPTHGTLASGSDGYVTIVTAPARITHYMHVAVGDNGTIISLDGGSTDHFSIPANVERSFVNLTIPSGAVIQAKNLNVGSDYTNLYVSVW